MDRNVFLYIVLDTIKETCEKRRSCNGCLLYDLNYGCLVNTRPDMWDTDIIKENIDRRNEV